MASVLSDFGQLLVQETRDKTITRFEKMVDGSLKTFSAKKVQEKLEGLTSEQLEAIAWLIPQIVDSSLHNLLIMIEEDPKMELFYRGFSIKDESDGLSGELFKEEGWIERFSTSKQ